MSCRAKECGSAPSYEYSSRTEPQGAPGGIYRNLKSRPWQKWHSLLQYFLFLMRAEPQHKPLAVLHDFKWTDNIALTSKSSGGPHRSIKWLMGHLCFAMHVCKGYFTGNKCTFIHRLPGVALVIVITEKLQWGEWALYYWPLTGENVDYQITIYGTKPMAIHKAD